MDVPFFRLSDCSEEKELVGQVLDSGWLTTGRFAAELETSFADYCQVQHAVAVNSCTAALHLAVEALGIGPGDQVAVPTLTFTASAEVIRYVGADPVFLDVDPDTLLVEPKEVARAIEANPGIKAIMAVHLAGQPVQLTGPDGLFAVTEAAGIPVLQDAAHAFPCWDDYGPVGSVGAVTCFSFYANKTMTTGEGGMLVTDDEALAQRARTMRLHGIDRDAFDRFTNRSSNAAEYDVVAPGFKYNLPDLNAAVGVAQFAKAFDFRDRREQIATIYRDAFADNPYIRTVSTRIPDADHSWHLFPIMLESDSPVTRDELADHLRRHGVGTSIHYRPLHRMSYYQDRYDLDPGDFPGAEHYWHRCLSLPIYPAMSYDDVRHVLGSIRDRVSSPARAHAKGT